jgi:hypothetical protein
VSCPRQGMGKASRRRIPGEPGPRGLPEKSGDDGPNRQRDETPGARPRRFKDRPWGVRWGARGFICFDRWHPGIGTGNGPPEREARERGNDEPGPKGRTRVEPMGDPRQAGTDRPLFEAPRSPIAGGAVWPRGWTIFARSCSEGRTPRARPVERHRGDPAGSKASRHMVSVGTQQDREPWKARSGGSAGLGCAVGAMNLERAVECRNGAGESTQPKARGCLGNTLKQGRSLRKGTRLIESEGLPHDWTPRGG